jgi:hypothetical protein
LVFNKVENFLLRQTTEITQKFFDMSITSDAVRIVKELIDEILGMVHLGRVQEMMDGRMTTGKSEVMEEHDWVKEVEAEEKEKFVKRVVKPVDVKAIYVECDFCHGQCICEELYEEMKEEISGMERVNRKDIAMKKEETVQEYKAMGFNWKQVDPIFKGDFRYVYIDSIDGFSARNFDRIFL